MVDYYALQRFSYQLVKPFQNLFVEFSWIMDNGSWIIIGKMDNLSKSGINYTVSRNFTTCTVCCIIACP